MRVKVAVGGVLGIPPELIVSGEPRIRATSLRSISSGSCIEIANTSPSCRITTLWGIHLTGASARRAGNSPWSVRRRAFQAG